MSDSVTASPLDSFTGRIEPARVPLVYQIGLGFVALTMVLLPLIYIGLIAAVIWVVWWHLLNDLGMFEHLRGRASLIGLVLYLGPAVAGLIFVLFLIKPLFSRAQKQPPPFKVLEANEPELFALVGKICEVVGAPKPREIRLDAQVNASAGFRRGWLSFFGNDLVLVIGLPLAAGMTMRQLAGVLAHEFGHFAQGAGMRFSYIIRSVNAWFARVVYERDHWDDQLAEWAATENLWLKLVFLLAKGGVWVGRRVLWCLMQAGHAMSCFMSRQMEFDADSYEAQVAGSEEFARTAERLRVLNAAHGAAMNDAYQTFQSKELPDDLPALVVWRESVIPEKVRQEIEKQAVETKTQWNQTHPCDADRVKAALALKAEGVFHLEAPASQLFSDFTSLSRAVTRHFFQHQLDISLDNVQFRSAARMVQDRQAADESDQHIDLFYGKCFHFMRLSPLDLDSTASLHDATRDMEANSGYYEALLVQFNDLENQCLAQTIGADLIRAKFSLPKPDEFKLTDSTERGADAALVRTQQELTALKTKMEPYERAASQRLSASLRWIISQGQEPKTAQLHRLLTAQQRLGSLIPDLLQASRATRSLGLLFDNAANHNDGYTLQRQARAIAERIEVATNRCIATLAEAAHPYLENHPPIASALRLPDRSDQEFARAYQLSQVCTEALIPLLVRIMGDLCGLALAAEKDLENDPARHEPPVSRFAPPAAEPQPSVPCPIPSVLPPPSPIQ
jgi:Zn-dependent protease with chaperone function